MRKEIKALVLTCALVSAATAASCARTYVYAESECSVKERREDGTLVMVCYDKSLRKDSHREPREPREVKP